MTIEVGDTITVKVRVREIIENEAGIIYNVDSLGLSFNSMRVRSEDVIDGWVYIKERLPELDQYVFIAVEGKVYMGRLNSVEHTDEGRNLSWISTFLRSDVPITHWLPLPEPPEVKGESR